MSVAEAEVRRQSSEAKLHQEYADKMNELRAGYVVVCCGVVYAYWV